MPRKAVITFAFAVALAAGGCTTARKEIPAPAPPSAREKTPPVATPAPTVTPPKPARHAPSQSPRPAASPARPAKSLPQASLPALIEARSSWVDYGRTLMVTRANAPRLPPVPLFRQAIVLAAVRAAVAGSPAVPKAEFRHGLLTLTFAQGTPAQIATAVNSAIAVPEVVRLGVILGD